MNLASLCTEAAFQTVQDGIGLGFTSVMNLSSYFTKKDKLQVWTYCTGFMSLLTCTTR